MLYNIVFANDTSLWSFFFFFLIIAAVIAQFFNANAELVIRVGIPAKKAKVEIEKHPVTAEAKIRKCLLQFRFVETFNLVHSMSLMKYFLVSCIFFNLNSWLMFMFML